MFVLGFFPCPIGHVWPIFADKRHKVLFEDIMYGGIHFSHEASPEFIHSAQL